MVDKHLGIKFEFNPYGSYRITITVQGDGRGQYDTTIEKGKSFLVKIVFRLDHFQVRIYASPPPPPPPPVYIDIYTYIHTYTEPQNKRQFDIRHQCVYFQMHEYTSGIIGESKVLAHIFTRGWRMFLHSSQKYM